MPTHKVTVLNFTDVLSKIKTLYEIVEGENKDHLVKWLNTSLDELLHEDFFGTEGQLDPRGDQRD